MPRLAAGTVQLGTAYGVANKAGQTPRDESRRIVEFLLAEGVRFFDTAPVYGESESVLGACLPVDQGDIITKTVHFRNASITADDADDLMRTFDASLARLNREFVYGLLIHNANDLLKPGAERLWQAMHTLRQNNKVTKIGISVYNADQIEQILARFDPDLIQLPFNALDQRLLLSGHLAALKKRGIEIHSRSAFLQGLLLMEPHERPAYFAPYQAALRKFDDLCKDLSLSPLQTALGYAMSVEELDCIVIGGCDVRQWREIVEAGRVRVDRDLFAEIASAQAGLLDPSHWKVN